MDEINAADLDFSTLSTKNKPILRYNDKLLKRGKIARNHVGIINNSTDIVLPQHAKPP